MTPYQFFLKHAGFSYGPGETREQGRRRCAKALAKAEREATNARLSFCWEYEQHIDSSDWSDEEPAYRQWYCLCRNADGDVVASLGCIDFGRDGTPWRDPYGRVVEA